MNWTMRDLRKYSRQTTARLVIGFVALLFLIGLGLIYMIYGREGAAFGFVCLLAALAPLGLIWLVLRLLEWIVQRANSE